MTNNYFHTDQIVLPEFKDELITQKYNEGYVLTRLAKGTMNQTRSLRVDLAKFHLYTKNHRVLRKTEGLQVQAEKLPLQNYSWEIHKLGKDFYSTRFGDNIMTASKIKEMFTEAEKSNMNYAFVFKFADDEKPIGYTLSYMNDEIVHYAYPFYHLDEGKESHLGFGMILNAILWAQKSGKKYFYLGSVTDEKSKYKLQLKGLEWWDTSKNSWDTDIEKLKQVVDETKGQNTLSF